jgi:hypothetical protein
LKKNTQEIFGKIDALLGKRETDVFVDKGFSNEDFPTLTDIVSGATCYSEASEPSIDSLTNLTSTDMHYVTEAKLHALLYAMEKRIVDLVQSRHEEILRILMDRDYKS